ncbi:hypothetical protein EDF81_0085 [Enterobacter sp. BIGb0383]|nr:hypothetical protein EDF81_0085 [Enterobacter sp. BIGb0383]ROS11775.1 hypothetical protein EC848_0085 [Enterobacter sp. BIGb0359]
MSGFQLYNSKGFLTIDSSNKSIVTSRMTNMGTITDRGYYSIDSAFGNGSTLGFMQANFFPTSGLIWFQPTVDGRYNFPGANMYDPGTGRFMFSDFTTPIVSGYLDTYDANGTLVWSAASAGTMPRIRDFFTVPPTHNLGTAITLNTSFANPWICVSQCPGNLSDDGDRVGYSGILIRRNSSTSFSLQYVNQLQKNYTQAMGSNGLNIAIASFTGY